MSKTWRVYCSSQNKYEIQLSDSKPVYCTNGELIHPTLTIEIPSSGNKNADTASSQTMLNKNLTNPTNDITANKLRSANDESINIVSGPPTINQVLVTTSPTTATWQTSAATSPALLSIANLPTSADQMLYTTSGDVYAATSVLSLGRTFLAQSTTSAQQSVIDLVPGTDVQTWDSSLQSIADINPAQDKIIYTSIANTFSATGITAYTRTLLDDSNAATARATLELTGMATKTPVPSGDVLGTTDTQVLTNKTLTNTTNDIRGNRLGDTAGTFTVELTTGTGTPTAGQLLTADGLGNATWQINAGGVSGPVSSVDNTLPRFNGISGDTLQTSGIIVDDSNNITGVGTLTSSNIVGSINTAAQTNITSVGTLTALTVTPGVSNMAAGTFSGLITMNGGGNVPTGHVLTVVDAPTSSTHVTNKSYVDNVAASGIKIITASQAATTGVLPDTPTYSSSAGTLTAVGGSVALTIDAISITASSGQRVLVKDQADDRQNGVYERVADNTGNWVLQRTTDFNTASIPINTFTFVEAGTANANTGWVTLQEVTQFDPSLATPGTSDVIWAQNAGQTTLNAGTGMVKTGSTLNVGGTTNRISVDSTSVDIDSAYIGQSTITTLGTVATGTWNATTIGATKGGTGLSSPTTGNFVVTAGAGNMTLKTCPTGEVVGISDTQTLTNKTVTDSLFTVQNNADNTKKFKFQTSAISTGTTRTYIVPNASTTFIGTDTSSTLTNKNITGATNTIAASQLRSATTDIVVSAATAPTSGQALIATSGTAATWQTITHPGIITRRVVRVAQADGEYTSLASAIADINAGNAPGGVPTEANQIVIEISPGLYSEVNPLVVPSWVTIRGLGQPDAVVIKATVGSQDVFQLSAGSALERLNINGLVSTGPVVQARACVFYTSTPGNNTVYVFKCICTDGQYGIWVQGDGTIRSALMNAENIDIFTTTSGVTMDVGVRCTSGAIILGKILQTIGSIGGTLTTGFQSEGDWTTLDLNTCNVSVALNAFIAKDGGSAVNVGGDARAVLRINGSTVNAIGNGAPPPATTGVVFDLGLNAVMEIYSTHIIDTTAFITNVLHFKSLSNASPNQSKIIANGFAFRYDKVNLAPNTLAFGMGTSVVTGEEKNVLLGELSVGFPGNGFESAFGEGDSHVLLMTIFSANPAESVFVDETSNALSHDDNTFTFQSTAVNERIYIGGSIQAFPGIKTKINTGIVPAGGLNSIIWEYWNGSIWASFNIMSTQSEFPYTPFAQNVFDVGHPQYRFGSMTGWVSTSVNGVNAFWIRARITTILTTLPTIDHIKLHTNRTEINKDGFIEYFGKARVFVRIPFDINLVQPANDSPANQDLFISDNLNVGRIENSFVNGATDRTGFTTDLPSDLDTSFPLELRWRWINQDANGNIKWNVRWGWTTDFADDTGAVSTVNVSTAAAPITGPNEQSVIILSSASGTAFKQHTAIAEINISNMVSDRVGGYGDMLWVAIERDGSHVDDTNTGDAYILQISPYYCKWREGGGSMS